MKSLIWLMLLAGVLAACQQPSTEVSEESLTDRIARLERNLYDADGRLNIDQANELIASYLEFSTEYADHELAPEMLFKAADISINFPNTRRTLVLLNRITDNYPAFEKVGLAAFLKAFVYDTQLGDTARARTLYQEFIEANPAHAFVPEAEAAIRNLGKSPEDLIREFEQMNRSGD